MTYYVIRHKQSLELMPQIRRGKGYTHWNPATGSKPNNKTTNVPRIFETERIAHRAVIAWATMPNATMRGYTTYSGEDDYDIDFKEDGRTKDDLEIIPASLEIDGRE